MAYPITKEEVLQWLEVVNDPEIPVLSLVDLGVITKIDIDLNFKKVNVEMTPTFVGCPALEIMKQEVVNVIQRHGVEEASVSISFKTPWSSDMISEKGRAALKKFGLTPPPTGYIKDIDFLDHVECPRCTGTNTEIRSLFGSTLCRSIHYCLDCKESFEQFKPL